MPELKITPEDIGPARIRTRLPMKAYLMALMLWPDDVKMVADSVLADADPALFDDIERASSQLGMQQNLTSVALGRVLLAAPPHQASILDLSRRFSHGLAVGLATISMLRSPKAKLKAALAAAVEELNKAPRTAREMPPIALKLEWPNLETNVWPDFRSVAHLWAAFCSSLPVAPDPSFPLFSLFPCDAAALPEFLAAVEYLRRRGEKRRFLRSNGVLFPAGAMWVVPPGIKLPEPPEKLVSVLATKG